MNILYYGDNLKILRDHIKDESVGLVYLDPRVIAITTCCTATNRAATVFQSRSRGFPEGQIATSL